MVPVGTPLQAKQARIHANRHQNGILDLARGLLLFRLSKSFEYCKFMPSQVNTVHDVKTPP
jgi:hypothetical protein